MRRWLADRLRADFVVANAGRTPRYVLPYPPGVTTAEQRLAQQDRWLAEIGGTGWDESMGNWLAEVLARELGLPVMLYQSDGSRPLRPGELTRSLALVRTPNHFDPGWPAEPGPAFDFSSYQPLPASTVEAGRCQRQRVVGQGGG